MEDNIEQIKLDLQKFLYHLRLRAEVFVVPLVGNISMCSAIGRIVTIALPIAWWMTVAVHS